MPQARTRRVPHYFQRRILYTAILSLTASTSAVAQSSESLDCSNAIPIDSKQYDLKSLDSERTVQRTRHSPPTTTDEELRFNICQDLTTKEGVPEADQCPKGTRACLTAINKKPEKEDRVIAAIPVAQTSNLKPSYAALQSNAGISIQLHGPSYPPDSPDTPPVPQSFNLTLLCTQDGGSDPKFINYENGIVSVEWKTSAGCPAQPGDSGGDGGNNGGGEDREEGGSHSTGGSSIGWFFLLLLVSFLGYFAVGAYYNYNNFGATGWDLVPHRDFWRDVPYLLQDFTDHLCTTLRPGRQGGSRRGYMAV